LTYRKTLCYSTAFSHVQKEEAALKPFFQERSQPAGPGPALRCACPLILFVEALPFALKRRLCQAMLLSVYENAP